MKERFSKYIKSSNNEIHVSIGIIEKLKQIGEGGNSIVYSGLLNHKDVAIKVFTEFNDKKNLRGLKQSI